MTDNSDSDGNSATTVATIYHYSTVASGVLNYNCRVESTAGCLAVTIAAAATVVVVVLLLLLLPEHPFLDSCFYCYYTPSPTAIITTVLLLMARLLRSGTL